MTTPFRLISSITPQDGFHPTTRIIFSDPDLLAFSFSSNCTLYLYLILPPLIFIDPYELSHYAQFYTFKHWGTANLELPVHAVPQNNSVLLLNVTVPTKLVRDNAYQEGERLEVKVPLHLRYGNPGLASNSGYYHTAEMDWPTGFIACPRNLSGFSQSETIPVLPSEVVSFLEAQTTDTFAASHVLVPVQPGNYVHEHTLSPPRITVRVPVANPTDLRFVEAGTVITIFAAFFYLAWISLRTARNMRRVFRNIEFEKMKTK